MSATSSPPPSGPPSRTSRGSSRSARRSTRTPGARSGSCGASSSALPAPARCRREPAREEEDDAALPARPSRRPQARDPARRPQPSQRAGDVAARVPRRRARGPAQRRRGVPRAAGGVRAGARVRPLAPQGPLGARAHGPRARSRSARLFADQDGLFGSACTQYRDSMNEVADWAKERGLMDHTGDECVPRQVSLLEAHVNQPTRVALLQHHDGYGPELEVGAELPASYQRRRRGDRGAARRHPDPRAARRRRATRARAHRAAAHARARPSGSSCRAKRAARCS